MSNENSSAKEFRQWKSERMGHPYPIQLAAEDISELEDKITQLEKELAELRPVAAQAKQWRDEHLRMVKVNDKLRKDKAELVCVLEACQDYIKDVPILRVGARELLERMK